MANLKDNFFYIEISEMDYLLICNVKELRVKMGLSQVKLSHKLKLASGWVSKVETFGERAKYSVRHLPLLAKAFECEIKDLFPMTTPKNDMVRLTLRRVNQRKKDGSISTKMVTELVKVDPII